jgi:hypothetical protein
MNIAQLDHIVLLQRLMCELRTAGLMNVNIRASPGSQIGIARHMIGMQMGFDDVCDLQPPAYRYIQVLLDFAIRIHNGSHPFGFASH